jgi:hypothetical protein
MSFAFSGDVGALAEFTLKFAAESGHYIAAAKIKQSQEYIGLSAVGHPVWVGQDRFRGF